MLETINTSILHSGSHLELVQLNLKGGAKYEAIRRIGNKNAVAGIVTHRENESYIFIEQYRYPIGQKVLELVAGLIDKEKNIEEIMKEEVIEETGYQKIDNMIYLGDTAGCAGAIGETAKVFDIEVSGEKGEQDLGEMEDIKVIEIPFRDFDSFIDSQNKKGFIIDPKVYMAAYYTNRKLANLVK